MTSASSDAPVRFLLYSDDADTRAAVRAALGDHDPSGRREIEWVETATHAMVEEYTAEQRFDLMILDAETDKAGGMGVCRQLKNQVFECPPIVVLTARAADAWLAAWSQADAIVQLPLDPFTFPHRIFELLPSAAA